MEKNSLAIPFKAVIIGGSAGSLDVLLQVFPGLRKDLQIALIIVMHRKNAADSLLTDLLTSRTTLPVKEADEKEPVLAGNIYLAPADYHLLIEKNLTFSLDYSEKIQYSRPSIDVSFESAADVFKNQLTGILLSGANADGVNGLIAIRENGGTIIAQSPETADVSYMPQQAIQHTKIDHIFSAEQITTYINNL